MIVDAIEERLGGKHSWLSEFFGALVYVRYVSDAGKTLTRVGRYADARRMVDAALERLNSPPALLLGRAEMSWPYDPETALADLEACERRGDLHPGGALLGAWLTMEAGAPPFAAAAKLPQQPIVAAAAALRRGDRLGHAAALNSFFISQGLAAPLPPDTSFTFEELARPAAGPRNGPLVSVVMTTYNSAATLDYAVGSILGQTHGALELFIVDDGSQDGTRDRLAAFAAADPRVRVILNDENVGTYVAKNRAIAEAAGVYPRDATRFR